ncbi:MAG: rhodanese-like domain-containing protein [Alphaproteobacteria bacterium]|nr:rhodanese-like domain-containing protein [Alphaproteobacteria bacterium]
MTSTITVGDAFDMIKNGDAVLVDVREPDEFKSEHIAYAISVPLSTLEAGFQILDIPEHKTILFQCLKGTRGQMACERIQGVEYCQNKLVNIEGGIEAWKQHGLPVIGVRESLPKISMFRQIQMIVGLLVVISVLVGFMGLTLAFVFTGVLGGMLFFAGISGWCGLAIVLAKMPWNK